MRGFRGLCYAHEVKIAKNYTGEKSHVRLVKYLPPLGRDLGWMPIFAPAQP